jgi:hypothetical protein
MPIYMDILRIDRLVVIVARGHVTAEVIAENTRSLIAADVPGFAKIIDVAGSASDLTRDQVQRIADLLRGGPDSPFRGPRRLCSQPGPKGFRRSVCRRYSRRKAHRALYQPPCGATVAEGRKGGSTNPWSNAARWIARSELN